MKMDKRDAELVLPIVELALALGDLITIGSHITDGMPVAKLASDPLKSAHRTKWYYLPDIAEKLIEQATRQIRLNVQKEAESREKAQSLTLLSSALDTARVEYQANTEGDKDAGSSE